MNWVIRFLILNWDLGIMLLWDAMLMCWDSRVLTSSHSEGVVDCGVVVCDDVICIIV